MAKPKNIFDLIRENQHKLEETPSPRTWRELEQKLDNRRRVHHLSWRRFGAAIAAGLLLLLTISTIIWLNQYPKTQMAFVSTLEQMHPIENTDQAIQLTKVSQEIYRSAYLLNEGKGGNFIAKSAFPPSTNISPTKIFPQSESKNEREPIAALEESPKPALPDVDPKRTEEAVSKEMPPSSPPSMKPIQPEIALEEFAEIDEDFSAADITAEEVEPPRINPDIRVTPNKDDFFAPSSAIAESTQKERKLENQLHEKLRLSDIIEKDQYSVPENGSTEIAPIANDFASDGITPRKKTSPENLVKKKITQIFRGSWKEIGRQNYIEWNLEDQQTIVGTEISIFRQGNALKTRNYKIHLSENPQVLELADGNTPFISYSLVKHPSDKLIFESQEQATYSRIIFWGDLKETVMISFKSSEKEEELHRSFRIIK